MSIFNLIFFKKALFVLGTLGLSSAPISIIVKKGGIGSGVHVSEYKKNLKNISTKYSSVFGIEEFFKEVVLYTKESKKLLESVFAKDLALNILKSHKSTRLFLDSENINERKIHDAAYASHSGYNQQFYDKYLGDRQRMKRKYLSEQSFDYLLKEYLNFDLSNFTLNRNKTDDFLITQNYYFSKEDLSNKENWENIKFFPKHSKEKQQDLEFIKHKFEFINYAYKRWFEEIKPFYIWMALWKYKERPTDQEIDSVLKSEKIKSEAKLSEIKGSYEWPIFDSENKSGISTVDKFKKFFKNIVSTYDKANTQELFIPKGYTEDSSTSILVEGANMYTDLYTKFAAASNWLYNQQLAKLKGQSINSFNSIQKSTNLSSYQQILELFLTTSDSGSNRYLKNNPDFFKNSVFDFVTVQDTPFAFVRNQAGVHLVASDFQASDQANQTLTDAFHHFNYRTLQLIKKQELNIANTLDLNPNSSIERFKFFLKENFSALLVNYWYSKNPSKPTAPDSTVTDLKEVYEQLDKLEDLRKKYIQRDKLREALLTSYGKQFWISNNQKYEKPKPEFGIQGLLPWKIDENPDETKDFYVFGDLEKFFDWSFFSKSEKDSNKSNNTDSETLSSQASKINKQISEKLSEAVANLSLGVNRDIPHYATDRIFSNNFLVDWIIELFLNNSESLNQLIYSFFLKTEYVRHSVIGSKNLVDKDKSLIFDYSNINAANNAGGNSDDFLNKLSEENNQENYKKLFDKFEDIVKSFFYSKFVLEDLNRNPWLLYKYSGKPSKNIDNDFDKNFANDLKALADRTFKERFELNIDNFRDKHYRFINTLVYLTSYDFENFLKLFNSKINKDSDAFLLYENIKNSSPDTKISIPKKSLKNPYLFSGFSVKDTQESTDSDIQNIQKWFMQKFWTDSENKSSTKVSEDHILKGLYIDDPRSSNPYSLSSEDKDSLKNKSLIRYGSNSKDMNEYILSISNTQEFNKIINHLKSVISSDKWPSILESDHIYIKNNSDKTHRTLTLQERKNLLSAILNKHKVEITNNEVDKTKYKDYFLTDPDANFSYDSSKHQAKQSSEQSYEEKWSEATYFQNIKKEIEKDSEKRFTLLQLNNDMFKDFDSFKTWVNKNLSKSLFWNWIFSIALTPEASDLAESDLVLKSQKIDVYDAKWKTNLKSGYLN